MEALVALLFVLYKAPVVWRERRALDGRLLSAWLFGLAVIPALLFQVATVYEGVGRLSGWPNLAWLLSCTYGFHLGGQDIPYGRFMGQGSTSRTFGHFGQRSSMVWADPDSELVVALTCNRLLSSVDSRARWQSISNAVWEPLSRGCISGQRFNAKSQRALRRKGKKYKTLRLCALAPWR
jgi:CubicO group peptidase (beta-lactamase class C family)